MNDRPPEIITLPAYSYAEADALAGVSRGTAKRWIEGYFYTNSKKEKVFSEPVTPGIANSEGISFLDLIEVAAIGQFLEHKFNLREIRRIVRDCQAYFGLERPLTTAKFKVGARQAFVEHGGGALFAVGVQKGRGTFAMAEILGPFLDDLDYTDDWVTKWWPLGRDQFIVIDPAYGYGQPVVAGTGVRTEIIRERALANDLPEIIAKDFNITREAVDRALQFELSRAA